MLFEAKCQAFGSATGHQEIAEGGVPTSSKRLESSRWRNSALVWLRITVFAPFTALQANAWASASASARRFSGADPGLHQAIGANIQGRRGIEQHSIAEHATLVSR
jgi:hypothetical protein